MKLLNFLNPIEWVRASRFAKQNSKFSKSSYDLELHLYSKILSNNMLHYGYFEDTSIASETISFKQLEDAQVKYAENIIEHIVDYENPVLDVGCGTGGLSELMHQKNLKVESLTPNKNQVAYINQNFKHLTTHNCKFEKFVTDKKYGTVINSESLQYISLDDAFENVEKIILPNGRWIIVDYFRINSDGINKSGHQLEDFRKKVQESNWEIVNERDITLNVLPTLNFVYMYLDKLFFPIKHFGYEKFRFKSPKLFYMTRKIRESIDNKIKKESASVDPKKFVKEKAYMFFVLENKNK